MRVTLMYQIRDASGDFACPNEACWREHTTRVRPGDMQCPQCGTALEWDDDAVAAHHAHVNRQPLDARAHLGDGDAAAREAGAAWSEASGNPAAQEHVPEPLGIVELLMRVGEQHVKVQNLAASMSEVKSKKHGVVLITFGTDQITAGDLLRLGEKPWEQLPMTGLVVWMPTVVMQAAIRAHVAASNAPPPSTGTVN